MIKARPNFRNAYEFSKTSLWHFSYVGRANSKLYVGEVGYVQTKSIGNQIVNCPSQRLKMYSFIVCDASEPIQKQHYPMDERHKTVANGVARSHIKRCKHEQNVVCLIVVP